MEYKNRIADQLLRDKLEAMGAVFKCKVKIEESPKIPILFLCCFFNK